jgi:hypothetical protein
MHERSESDKRNSKNNQRMSGFVLQPLIKRKKKGICGGDLPKLANFKTNK